MIKRSASLVFILLLFSFFNSFSARAETVSSGSIIIDGISVKTKYYLQNGHLMVPALFFKNTGVPVDWNSEYQSVVLTGEKLVISLPAGKNYADYYTKSTGQWSRDFLETTTTNFTDGTYIPLLYVANKLAMTVRYNSQSSTTYIYTNIPQPKVYYKSTTSLKKVALTFDDGPDQTYTSQILDILKEKQAIATFFVVGRQASGYPEVLQRIVKEGHSIGNHTWSHPKLPNLTTSQIIQEVQSTADTIQAITGRKTDLFRPPYGAYTKPDIRQISNLGYRSIQWSVDTLDWSGKSADEILSIVNSQIQPGGIILQHCLDFEPGILDGTVEALPLIIDQLREQGYEFVTVETLLENQ